MYLGGNRLWVPLIKGQTSWLFTQRLERYSRALGYNQDTCCAGLGNVYGTGGT